MLDSFFGFSIVGVEDGTGDEGRLTFGVGVVAVSMAIAVTAVGGIAGVVALVMASALTLVTTNGVAGAGCARSFFPMVEMCRDTGGLTMVAVTVVGPGVGVVSMGEGVQFFC